jgi:hypothetical protein
VLVNNERNSISGVVMKIVPSIQPNRTRSACSLNEAIHIGTPQEFAAVAVDKRHWRADAPYHFNKTSSRDAARTAVANARTRAQAGIPSPSNAPTASFRKARSHDLRLLGCNPRMRTTDCFGGSCIIREHWVRRAVREGIKVDTKSIDWTSVLGRRQRRLDENE